MKTKRCPFRVSDRFAATTFLAISLAAVARNSTSAETFAGHSLKLDREGKIILFLYVIITSELAHRFVKLFLTTVLCIPCSNLTLSCPRFF
jgi:hypothetical protein